MAISKTGQDGPPSERDEIDLPDTAWRERLSYEAYHILREAGTEPPGSSRLNYEKRPGSFLCAGCGRALFSSEHKYDSGSGWPSFWQPAQDAAIDTAVDYKLARPRTEVRCAGCGGHLGHVFEDGPRPTGLRYCINGAALSFQPEKEDDL